MKIAIPTKTSGEKSFVSEHFSMCNFFYIYDSKTKIGEVYANKFKSLDHGRGRGVASFLKEKGVEVLIATEIGSGAKTALGPEIKLYEATEEIVSKNIQSYLDNELVTL